MNRYNQSGAIQMMNVKAVLLCGAAIFVATSAQAETRWSGFAINAGFGAGAMVNDLKILPGPLVPPGLFAVDLDGIGGEGVLGTIGVSADYQFQRRFVVGAFFDYDFSGIKSTLDVSIPTLGNLQARGDTKLDSQWTVGARLGYLTSPEAQRIIPTTNWMYPVIDIGADLPAAFGMPPAKVLVVDEETIAANSRAWVDAALAALQ